MTCTVKVENGIVPLPSGVKLPDGMEVQLIIPDAATVSKESVLKEDPFLAAVEKLAKPRPHWPNDYALNHGHYVSGEPKKP